MSIFDNVKSIKRNPQLELLIRLKYGEPNLTLEFLESLPEAVVREAARIASPAYLRNPDIDTQRQVLNIMYRQAANKITAIKAVEEALYNYHLLLS